MGTRIKDAELIEEVREDYMLAVGNTDSPDTASAITIKGVKEYIDQDKAEVAFTGSYLNLTDTPNLESYVQLTTLNQNYYTKQEVNSLVSSVNGVVFEKVEELPDTGESGVIYLVPHEGGGLQNIFDEYVWLPLGLIFEKIGTTQADFDNYYTIAEVDALIPTVNNATVTINQGGVTKGTFTLNQSTNTTINLSGIGVAQVQADWDQDDVTAVDYIKNKPDIQTVYDSEVLFTSGGVEIGRIKLNQSTASTIEVGSGGITVQSDWMEIDPDNPAYIKNKPSIPTVNNSTIVFTQGGVTVGSIQLNQANGATIAFSSGGSGGVQSNWLESDSTALSYIQNKPNLATVATSGSYNDLTNKPTIPTNTRSLLITYDNQTTETIVVYVQ